MGTACRNAADPTYLTETAASDFRAARRWSRARWGEQQTRAYFTRLHDAAEYVAARQAAVASRADLIGDTKLGIYPVGEHFLVYAPIDRKRIAVVALMRQVRDVPAILQANHFQIQRVLEDVLKILQNSFLGGQQNLRGSFSSKAL